MRGWGWPAQLRLVVGRRRPWELLEQQEPKVKDTSHAHQAQAPPPTTGAQGNAGGMGSVLGQGTKITHAAGQISPHTVITEPVCPGELPPPLHKPLKNLSTTF